MNMPLTLTDPTGHSWLSKLFHSIGQFLKKWGSMIISIALMFFGVPPFLASFISSAFSTAVNGGSFGSFLVGFVVGAIAGAVAAPIGGAISGALHIAGQGFFASLFQGAVVGALAGGISSVAMGGSFWAGFVGGALAGALAAGLTWGAKHYLTAGEKSVADNEAKKLSDEGRRLKNQAAIDEFKAENPGVSADFENRYDTWAIRTDSGRTLYFDSYSEAERYMARDYSASWVGADVSPWHPGTVRLYATFSTLHSVYGWVPKGNILMAALWHEMGHVAVRYGGGGFNEGGFFGLANCSSRGCEVDATQWAMRHFH